VKIARKGECVSTIATFVDTNKNLVIIVYIALKIVQVGSPARPAPLSSQRRIVQGLATSRQG
jgi:hypothetical protein